MPTIVAVFILSGCYPSLLTSQPEAEIIVTDESGAPLVGATVALGTMEWRGIGGRNTLEKCRTDHKGRVEFGKQHDWAVQSVVLDWRCLVLVVAVLLKAGFEAIPMVFMKFDQPIKVTMYPKRGAFGMPVAAIRDQRPAWRSVKHAGSKSKAASGRQTAASHDHGRKYRRAMEASTRPQGQAPFLVRIPLSLPGARQWPPGHTIVRPHDMPCASGNQLSSRSIRKPDDPVCFFDTAYTSQGYTASRMGVQSLANTER